MMDISVIIPTYNADRSNLDETLNALKYQTLNYNSWELIIIDNNSNNGVLDTVNITWHPNHKIIKELKQGLTYSRIAGVNAANGNIVIMVDDDNLLAPNYIETTRILFEKHPRVGAIGGKIIGKFNNYTPEKWTEPFWNMLAIRDLGSEPLISAPKLLTSYPDISPVGAGMGVRKALFTGYITELNKNSSLITDRSGDSLSSGGDNEINIQVLKQGYSVAYFPELELKHIIPPIRLTKNYLARLNYESSRSWVKLLLKYNLYPFGNIPPWTVNMRKLKTWVTQKAWKNQVNYIVWRGSCGTYEGLSHKINHEC